MRVMSDNKTLKEMEDTLIDLVDLLDKKRQEIIVTGGCIHSLKEASSSHANHLEKIRAELQSAASSGKMAPETGNLVLSYVSRSGTVINDCLNSYRSRYDIKTGEALAYDNLVKAIQKKIEKVTAMIESQQASPQPEPTFDSPPVLSFDEPTSAGLTDLNNESQKVDKPRGRRRPDERGPLSTTVKRLKTIRKNKKKEG
jgi:hypothetical protein